MQAIPPSGTPERAELTGRLADRAKFVRTETVRLTRIACAGHYTAAFSAMMDGAADAGR